MNPRNSMKTAVFVVLLFCAGCGVLEEREPLEQQDFLLSVEFESPAAAAVTGLCFRVRPCRTAAPFASRQLVYRTGEVEYETDFYNRLMVSPSENIDELTDSWLHQQGYTLCADGLSQPHYLLMCHLHDFYGDFRDRKRPAAVVKMQWYLIHEDPSCNCSKTMLNQTYQARVEFETNTAGELVQAHCQALRRIFAELSGDLAELPL